MPSSVLGRALLERRRSIVGWAAGAGAAAALSVAVYPTIRDNPAVRDLLDHLPAGLLRLLGISPDVVTRTPMGFLHAQLYGTIAPAIMCAFAIAFGSGATAAEEETGTADLLFAHPVSRTRVLLEQFCALALLTLAIAAAFAATIAAGSLAFGLGIPAKGIFGANFSLWLLGVFFGALAMALAAWRGRRGGAAAIATAIAIAMFFLNFFAPRIAALGGLDVLTAFFWYYRHAPILQGPNPGHLVLAGATAGLILVAARTFARKDLGAVRAGAARAGALDRMPGSIYGHALWRRRASFAWWAAGLCLLAALTAAFWPSLRSGPRQLEGVVKLVPREVLASFGISDPSVMLTAAGFLTGRLYGSLALVAMVAFGIATGAAEIAGEIRKGTMDLVLAAPVKRGALVAQRWAAMATLIGLLSLALAGTLAACNARFELDLGAGGLVAANVGLALVALLFGTLAMAVGSATGSVSAARGVPAAVAIGGFLCNALGATSPGLSALRTLSPLHWYLGDTPPLARGFGPGLALLAGGVLVLVVFAVAAFSRRDIASPGAGRG
ncbi:MAG: ABC transporter permease subunit [Planctomycetes bacterium]|nr:ABC transporter permease subunit [Planctomycetota bacterium]